MKGDPSSCKKTEIKKFFLHWFDCVVSLIFKRFSMASLQKELISRIESLQIDSIGSVSKCRSRFCFEFQLFFLWRFSNFFFFCIVTICFSWCHFKSVPGIFHLHKPCKKNGYWENVCEFFFFYQGKYYWNLTDNFSAGKCWQKMSENNKTENSIKIMWSGGYSPVY